MKKFPRGIVWIGDSSCYVASKSRYKNESLFLKAVLRHIRYMRKRWLDSEAGWYFIPRFRLFVGGHNRDNVLGET